MRSFSSCSLSWMAMAFSIVGSAALSPRLMPAQDKTSSTSATTNVTADYPKDRSGVFIQSSDWIAIRAAMPSKTRVKHGLAASLTYGVVAAPIIAEYDGLHAQVQVEPSRPVICICRVLSLPGTPVLVRLHANPKKNLREFDGGRMPVIGAKIADATQNDLIPADVSQPEDTVWLVQPRQALPPGEYALMLGTQNVSIFPFTVAAATVTPSPAKP
jgi:hypothetical protein